MASAVVVVRGETGQRPNAASPLKYFVLFDPTPATVSSTVIAMCDRQADADSVAANHVEV